MHRDLDDQKGFWLTSAPARGRSPLEAQRRATSDTATTWGFKVPKELRVGTLDALMALSDDLVKIDMFFENTTTKIARSLVDLSPSDSQLTVNGANIEQFVTNFSWEEARYPTKNSLRELVDQMSTEMSKLDEEMRTKSNEYNQQLQLLMAEDRKRTGNLLVRSLYDIVKPTDVVESDYLTTLIVAVPKYNVKDWENSYEKLCDYVVPRSSRTLMEDNEHALVTVTVFKRVADDFKNRAREKRFTVRDYHYNAEEISQASAELDSLNKTVSDLKNKLLRWTKVNFGEAFTTLMHLKTIRIFVESVLRYGLPVDFQAMLVLPKKGAAKKLRRQLAELYKSLESPSATGGDDDEGEEYFSYVSLRINLEFA